VVILLQFMLAALVSDPQQEWQDLVQGQVEDILV
jgi:hypothetical protein